MLTELTLELFVAGKTTEVEDSVARIKVLLDQLLRTPYRLDVVDVLEKPDLADLAHILVTPTLVVRFDSSERRLVGDLSDLSRLQLVIADSQQR
jgi:circadian clock protein KaiB